ncbi:MAG TPA: ATP-binding protein [Methanolinea sp.]|nr:ATP-binding protein [Methanolinea sp.]HQK56094.1 ATP-binding protein [Methanolinea sp.]
MTSLFDLLATLNPWWTGKEFETGKPRHSYFSKIQRYLETDEILVLSGVRRSGKTTLLFQTIKYLIERKHIPPRNILFVNCDEPEISSLENPLIKVVDTYRKEIPSKGTLYLVFDEIQGIPGWERTIKSLYDRKNYRILISGSSSYLLDSQLATLLSGRFFSIPVFPLDFREYLSFRGIELIEDPVGLTARKYEILTHLKRYLREGGFPIVVLQEDERTKDDYLKAYYDSIVYRDIIRVNEIRNQKALSGLLHYLFTNITAPYSYRRLKDLLGIDINAVQDYIHFAEMAKVLFEVPHFAYSLKAQKRPNRKIYCIDNGLRNAVSFRFSEDEGKLAENQVFVELLRSGATPFYWKKKKEVDFVVKSRDNLLTAINVSYTDTIPAREREGLQEFAAEFDDKVGEMIILTKDTEQISDDISLIPLWKWLLMEK